MVATLDDIYKQQARGKSIFRIGVTGAGTTGTAGAGTSGFFTLGLNGNSIGTTLPNTFGEFAIPSGLTGDLWTLASLIGSSTSVRGNVFARIYKVGTVSLTATGNQFTHDTATFPLLRSEFGASNKAQAFWPIIQVTTALSVTAAVFTMNYTNQTGGSITGTRSFTFPSATTGVSSAFFLPLEQGDWAARDISAINITTASTTGAATVWLMEELEPSTNMFQNVLTADSLSGYGLKIANQIPATATTGTATSSTVFSLVGTTASSTSLIFEMSAIT